MRTQFARLSFWTWLIEVSNVFFIEDEEPSPECFRIDSNVCEIVTQAHFESTLEQWQRAVESAAGAAGLFVVLFLRFETFLV